MKRVKIDENKNTVVESLRSEPSQNNPTDFSRPSDSDDKSDDRLSSIISEANFDDKKSFSSLPKSRVSNQRSQDDLHALEFASQRESNNFSALDGTDHRQSRGVSQQSRFRKSPILIDDDSDAE